MAIKLEDKPGVQAPNVAYPFGRPKDNSGSNDGMPLNVLTHGDFHQFFAKMMAESGIVYNDQPDNATDGFQYWLALIENMKTTIADEVPLYEDVSADVTLNANFSAATKVCYKYKDNTVMLRLTANITGNIITVSNLISGIPSGPGSQLVTAYVWLNSAGNINRTPISVTLSGTNIFNIAQINVASFDRFNLYLIYKVE